MSSYACRHFSFVHCNSYIILLPGLFFMFQTVVMYYTSYTAPLSFALILRFFSLLKVIDGLAPKFIWKTELQSLETVYSSHHSNTILY